MAHQQTTQERLDRLEDLEAIRELLRAYRTRLDCRDFAGYAELFTEDGEWHGGSDGSRSAVGGPTAILSMLRELYDADAPSGDRHVHVCTDAEIDLYGDEAQVRSNFLVIAHTPEGDGPSLLRLGEYVDHLVRGDDGRWLFRRRLARTLMPHPEPGEMGAR